MFGGTLSKARDMYFGFVYNLINGEHNKAVKIEDGRKQSNSYSQGSIEPKGKGEGQGSYESNKAQTMLLYNPVPAPMAS
jgi:hypothetical protein